MNTARLACYLSLLLTLWAASAIAQPPAANPSPAQELQPFFLGGIQTHEKDHQRWAAALHQANMNAVQVTVYAQQGAWNTDKLWYAEDEPSVLSEIRAARQNGLQVVLILRVALNHDAPENRFLWHGLTYPETDQALDSWFRVYTDFVVKWGRIAEAEGVDVLGIASEMNALAATVPVEEIPGLPAYYLDDPSQERLRSLVKRSEDLFTEDLRIGMGAGDFTDLDDFLVVRNEAERTWARAYVFDGEGDPIARINQRRQRLETRWREMIAAVRKVFSGRLTMAANFDNYHEVAFWDALDIMGINAYFPLRKTLETSLDEASLVDAWRQIFDDVAAFQGEQQTDLDVVFTELGYTRWQGVTVAPWSSAGFIPMWDPDGDADKDRAFFWYAQPYEPDERALAVRALHTVWRENPSRLAGVLYWKLSSRLELQRYEPFMLYLGRDAVDPLYDAVTQFGRGIRPPSPLGLEKDIEAQAKDAVLRNDLDALSTLCPRLKPSMRNDLLALAVGLGRGEMVRRLLAAGADPAARNAAGFSALHWVCYQDDPGLVDVLLESLGDAAMQPWLDDVDETPLMKCARLDHAEVARRLLEARPADVAARNGKGRTALHLAADQASLPTIQVLMDAGADLHGFDEEPFTPLHVAARRGVVDVVRGLARDSKGRANSDGNRPSHVAAYFGHGEAFRLLFEPSHAQGVNASGQGLLHLAARGGHSEVLETVLQHDGHIDRPDQEGWTPLFYAVQGEHPEVIRRLLEAGASMLHRDLEGRSPLHMASASSDARLLQTILSFGGDLALDVKDAKGNTALHHAAGWGRQENLRLLLAAGVDTGLQNKEGDTALDIADEADRRRAAQLLRPVTQLQEVP